MLKFCQLISTFNKYISLFEVPDPQKWLKDIHDFTLRLLNSDNTAVTFNCIHYMVYYWENLTYKCITKGVSPIIADSKSLITTVFENYVCYLCKHEETDGFYDAVAIQEKLEPISVLAKVDVVECVAYMISNLDSIIKMVKNNVLEYKKHLSPQQRDLKESEFWDPINVQKASWVMLIAGEILKADQKVIHKKVLQSKKKADVVMETLCDLSIETKSKVQYISNLCAKVFNITNMLKMVQPQVLKFPKKLLKTYMILERSL